MNGKIDEISIESSAKVDENGEVYIALRFLIPKNEKERQVVLVGFPIPRFEEYLSDCYRLLKELKLKMAINEQKEKERADSRALSDKTIEIKPDEPKSDRG